MSLYQPPAKYIRLKLATVPKADRPKARLIIDLASLLTGPTSNGDAHRIAASLLDSNDPRDVAQALRAMADRFEGK